PRMADWIARADEFMIGQRAVVVDGLSVDDGRGTAREIGHAPRGGAHVALLAGGPFLVRRRVAVLLPNRLQLDPGMDLHLVAGDAELRLLEHGRRDGLLMDADVSLAVGLIAADQDLQPLRVADCLEDAGGVEGAENRLVDVARRDAPRAVDFPVRFADAVAGDAGDSFAR